MKQVAEESFLAAFKPALLPGEAEPICVRGQQPMSVFMLIVGGLFYLALGVKFYTIGMTDKRLLLIKHSPQKDPAGHTIEVVELTSVRDVSVGHVWSKNSDTHKRLSFSVIDGRQFTIDLQGKLRSLPQNHSASRDTILSRMLALNA